MRFLLVFVSLTLLVSCKDLRDGYEKGFKSSFQKKFIASCRESAVKKGVTAELSNTYCTCVANTLTQKYSSTELTRLAANPDSPELNQAVKDCQQ